MSAAIQIRDADMVATAVADLRPGDPVRISGVAQGVVLTARDAIPTGHKIALRDIAAGEHILKYGEVIGAAVADIAAGGWVHVHNCRGVKARRYDDGDTGGTQ